MIKYLKKLFLTALVFIFTASICIFSVSAEARATIAFSSSKPTVGQSVSVKVTIDGGEPIYNATFDLLYDSNILQFVNADDTVNSAGAGMVKASPNPGGKAKATYTFNFTALTAGACNISVSGGAYGVDNDLSFGASATMTVADAAKPSNANLKSLSLSKGSLSPKFSANRTSYTATVDYSVTECRVYATAADEANGAKVSVTGNDALNVGKNTRTVTVTAASGAQKTYTITITRKAEGEEDEDSSSEPTTDEPTVNPLETTVGGANYLVATDIAGATLPNGFKATIAEFNGEQVAVAQDSGKNYTIYYLRSAESETLVPYLLDADTDTFEKLAYTSFGDNTYLFADVPSGYEMPGNYEQTTLEIGDFSVTAWVGDDVETRDFYYLYCFFDGNFGLYRYDKGEKTLQREPGLHLVSQMQAVEPAQGFAARFATLSANAKMIVVGLLLAMIAAAALVALLIVRLVRSRNELPADGDYDGFDNGFDGVSVTDGNAPENPDDAAELTEDDATTQDSEQ